MAYSLNYGIGSELFTTCESSLATPQQNLQLAFKVIISTRTPKFIELSIKAFSSAKHNGFCRRCLFIIKLLMGQLLCWLPPAQQRTFPGTVHRPN